MCEFEWPYLRVIARPNVILTQSDVLLVEEVYLIGNMSEKWSLGTIDIRFITHILLNNLVSDLEKVLHFRQIIAKTDGLHNIFRQRAIVLFATLQNIFRK